MTTLILQTCSMNNLNIYRKHQLPQWAKSATVTGPLSSLPSPFVVHCCLRKSFVFCDFCVRWSQNNNRRRKSSPLLGFGEKGNNNAWFRSSCGFVATALTPSYFSLFFLQLYDSQQKIDSGREWIVGGAKSFLYWMYFFFLLAAKTRLLSGSEAVVFTGRNLQQ